VRVQWNIDQLVVTDDGDEHVLGRPDLGAYVAVPAPGAVFVRTLQAGASLDEATARASETAGEPVDGAQFLAGLAAAGLLVPPAEGEHVRGRRIRWIDSVRPATARRLFGTPAWCLYTVAALTSAGLLIGRPDLRPSFRDAFFLPDPLLSTLLFLVLSSLGVALHEMWHGLAGRAAGVPVAFRVSYRGFYLVFETDLTPLVALPRRRRYGPFLAGMAIDSTVLAAALLLRLALPPSTASRALGAVVLSTVFSLVWQFAAVFMRSDCYAVLANALRCNSLYRTTQLVTKKRLWRLSPAETTELATMSAHDRRVARWFGIVHVAGGFVLVWAFLTLALPYLLTMGTWLLTSLRTHEPTSLAFWQSVIVLAVLLLQWAGPPLLAVRERRLRRAGLLH
jgi:putative peptide zinc metalloprotease protein